VASCGPNAARHVYLTFDDGFCDVVQNAAAVLHQIGFRAMMFLVADLLGGANQWQQREGDAPAPLASVAQVQEWLAAGNEIGSHTLTHPRLTSLPVERAREEFAASKKKLVSSAERVVRTTNKFGIDLEKADILVKEISFASLYPRAGSGTVEDRLAGNRFKMVLAVTTDGKATTGKGLSGKYVLTAEKAMRFGGRWLISRKVRWRKLPAGVVDANTAADVEFENYVAEQALIQRCRVHKLHNVPEHLPEEKQQQAAWRLRGAWAKAHAPGSLEKTARAPEVAQCHRPIGGAQPARRTGRNAHAPLA